MTVQGGGDIIPNLLSQLLSGQGLVAVPVVAGVFTMILGGGLYWKYRGAIQNRLRLLKEESWIFGVGVTMERIDIHHDDEKLLLKDTKMMSSTGAAAADSSSSSETMFANMNLLELNPDFQRDCERQGWNVYSLGDYLSSLRPKQLPKKVKMKHLPDILKQEVEAGLAAALLKAL
ncbi:MAG: hypothetical protein SGARI_007739, partial [Bacillariaceae sp.]